MNFLLSNEENEAIAAVEAINAINNTNTIRSGHSTCLRFNRSGDLLASGRVDGTVVIWDIETMGVARKMRGHHRSITSLSWSRCGRYLLSACQGWKAVLWDLKDGRRYREVRFRAPAYIAELNPFNHHQFVASIFEEQPILVDVSDVTDVKYPLSSVPKRPDIDGEPTEKQLKDDAKQMTTSTIYTSTGEHILAGTNKGWINVIDVKTRKTIYSEKPCSGVITTLRLNNSGRVLLINAQDRIVRTFHLPNLAAEDLDLDTVHFTEEHKFSDQVNRLSWNHVTFSSASEYVAASTYNNHEIYVWDRGIGSTGLIRILDGPKEEQGVVEWHPERPFIATCGLETGRIYIWSVIPEQKWSRLAPDFAQVEENQEYEEMEDEFDIYGQEELQKRRLDAEDEDVDVVTSTIVNGHSGGTGDFRMPILFDLGESDSEEEFIAVSTGTMRRRSPGVDGEIPDSEVVEDKMPSRKGRSGRGGRRR